MEAGRVGSLETGACRDWEDSRSAGRKVVLRRKGGKGRRSGEEKEEVELN